MTKSATTTECGRDDYHIMRHLFTEAMQSSITDERWRIFATYSDPGRTMLTQYEHVESGDRIRCESFDYEQGKYRKHIFTFHQGVDENADSPNAKISGPAGDDQPPQRIDPGSGASPALLAIAEAAQSVQDGMDMRDEDEAEWAAAGTRVSAMEMHDRRMRLARALSLLPNVQITGPEKDQ